MAADNEKELTVEELLRKKEEEERMRRAEEVKFKQDAIYWEEFTEDVVEQNEAAAKERIEKFEKDVEIEKEHLKQMAKDTGNLLKAGGAKISDEYRAVMDSLGDVQSALAKEYDNPAEAKKAYVKSIYRVLNNINRYRVSMAGKDGEIDEETKKQIIGLEKLDSLLRDRYRTLEEREYEDTIGAVAELFKVEADENAVGDEYFLQQGLGKIANMKKQIEDFREEIREGKTVVENPDELEVLIDNPLEREVLAPNPAKKEAEPVRVEDEHLTEQRDIEKERREEEKKEIEEGDLKNEEPQNVKELYGNASLQAAIEKEAEYRRGMDPNDEYGRTQIALSAKKSLYLEVLEQGAAKREKDLGQEKVDDILDRGLKDFNKNAVKARAFMAEYVGDKDFNREFGKRVLEGAKNGKVEQEQIRTFRDEALTACYKELPGKDLKALDKLSEMLGSNVNSKTLNLKKDKVLEKKMDEEQEKKIEHKLGGPKPLGLGR